MLIDTFVRLICATQDARRMEPVRKATLPLPKPEDSVQFTRSTTSALSYSTVAGLFAMNYVLYCADRRLVRSRMGDEGSWVASSAARTRR